MEAKVSSAQLNERTWRAQMNGRQRREYNSSPRVYVWPEGETIIQNLEQRRARPIKLFRALAVQALTDQLKIKPIKMRWSQQAGCGCGCSPGFILTDYSNMGKDPIPSRFDVSVKIQAS